MKIDFVKLLTGWGVRAVAGLSGFQAWLANILLNKLAKALSIAWKQTMQKLSDNKILKNYKSEISKGKDADEQKKIELEKDILTGGKS